jgi:hypothetical protein
VRLPLACSTIFYQNSMRRYTRPHRTAPTVGCTLTVQLCVLPAVAPGRSDTIGALEDVKPCVAPRSFWYVHHQPRADCIPACDLFCDLVLTDDCGSADTTLSTNLRVPWCAGAWPTESARRCARQSVRCVRASLRILWRRGVVSAYHAPAVSPRSALPAERCVLTAKA